MHDFNHYGYASRQSFRALLAAVLLAPIAPVLLAPLSTLSSAEARADDKALAPLVAQLGDASYQRRIEAKAKLLVEGAGAVAALQGGLASDDPEIHRACRRLLADIYDAEHAKALADFRANIAADGADAERADRGYGLPGWEAYQSAIGHDAAARELFAAMQAAEPALMAALAEDPPTVAAAFDGRYRQVSSPFFQPRLGAERVASLGTVATLLFIGGDERFAIRADSLSSAVWSSLVRQADFQRSLADGPLKPHARKLLGRWVSRPGEESQLQQKLMLAFQFDLPEGLSLGVKVASDADLHGSYRVYGVHNIGRIGGAAHAARLAALLEDQAACGHRMRAGRNNDDPEPIQIRDVALAWLIQLTGQKHAEYELPEAGPTFEMLRDSSYVNLQTLGFDSPAKREAALAKWKAYAAANPLPEPPAIEEPKSDEAAKEQNRSAHFRVGRALVGRNRARANLNAKRQAGAANGAANSEAVFAGGLPTARREMVQLLAAAEASIAKREYTAAARSLTVLLNAPEDALYSPDRQSPVSRSVRAAAEALLASLPAAGWKSYELQTGPEAASLLKEATEHGSEAKLAKLSQAYFFTRAGAEATHLLAADRYGRGRYLAAAQLWERLQARHPQAASFEPALSLQMAAAWRLGGQLEESERALRKAIDGGAASAVIAGERRALPHGGVTLPWLEKSLDLPLAKRGEPNWPLFQKDAAQSGLAPDGAPLVDPTYAVALAEDRRLAEAIDDLGAERRKQRTAQLPSNAPLVIDGTLLTQTATDVRAIDLARGETRWRAEFDDDLRHLLKASSDPWNEWKEFVADGLSKRLWSDSAWRPLSSDGRLVFLVEETPFGADGAYPRRIVDEDGKTRLAIDEGRDHNRLAAYDIASGKLIWEVGGPMAPSQSEAASEGDVDPFAETETIDATFEPTLNNDLAGVFFLAAPLPWADRLYVVGRRRQTSYLLALDPDSGRLLAQAPLFQHPATELDLNDRLAAAMGRWRRVGPSSAPPCAASGGVIVCPLGEGTFAAVDAATDRFLWIFRNPREDEAAMDPSLALARRRGLIAAREPQHEGWKLASATIAGDRVALAPEGVDRLYCLSLADGRVLWSAPRRDGLYVGGVAGDALAIVGETRLVVLSLANGQPREAAENDASGLDGGGAYPSGAVPVGRGYITNTSYHAPLSSGEIAEFDLATGKLVARSAPSRSASEGAVALGNLIRMRDFVISQSAGFVARFDTLSSRRRRLEENLAGDGAKPERQLALAQALLFEGRLAEALAAWRRANILDAAGQATLFEIITQGLQRDFPTYLPVAEEFASAIEDALQRESLVRELAAGYEGQKEYVRAAEQYLKLAEALPSSEKISESLLEPRAPQLDVLRERWLLARLTGLHSHAGEDARRQIEAIVRNKFPAGWSAALALETGPFHSPADQLAAAKEFANSLDAQAPLLAVYASGDETQRGEALKLLGALKSEPTSGPLAHWPRGAVEVDAAFQGDNNSPRLPLPVAGEDAPIERLWLELDLAHRSLIAKDLFGAELWSVALPPSESGITSRIDDLQLLQLGRLVFASDGQTVYGIDGRPESQRPKDAARLLWRRSAPESTIDASQQYRAQLRALGQGAGGAQVRCERLAAAGGTIFFQLGPDLIAARPVDGETLWQRVGVGADCDLLAEGEVVLATPHDSEEALAFSVLDGTLLNGAPAASLDGRLAVLGRRVLRWENGDRQTVLSLWDPWTGADLWRREFEGRSRACLVERKNEAAVLSPSGRLEIVECDAGQTRLLTGVEPADDYEAIHVLRDAKQYILATQRRASDPQQAGMMGGFLGAGAAPVNGYVAGIDPQSGKRRWSVPAVDQFLYIGRPAELPVLVMMARKVADVQGEATWPTQLIVVDRQGGRVLVDETDEGRTSLYEVAVNAKDRAIELRMNGPGLKLEFTDAPVKKRGR